MPDLKVMATADQSLSSDHCRENEGVRLARSGSGRELRSLERRLEDGYLRIEDAQRAGQDTSSWEDFWIQLLRQYESLVDDVAEAA